MNKIILFLALLISLPSFAQSKNGNNDLYVRLGNIKTTTTTAAQILALPRLTATPGIVVKYFTISIRTSGGDVFGPYFTKGSELTDEEIRIIKKVKGRSVKLLIEDIKVLVPDGMMRSISSIILTYSN